jgi:hypothetical protein
MAEHNGWERGPEISQQEGRPSRVGMALILSALALVGVAIAFQQFLERRLTKPQKARLRFYKYLRERGHLES